MVNNLCPADVNPEQCGQTDLSGDSTNAEGATVNFDLCIDDGAASQFFGSSPQQLAVGTAMQVSCSDWSGSADITSGSNTATTGPTPTVSAGSSATTLTTVTSSGPATALQTLYGECGTGPTYTGPTACQPTATCSSQNPYYSQCLPTSG
ncbi:hypothetical protein MMC08_001401 [Hypocenomyce scalaris]|nr:hypothetical protein [Hypocenomyce scalaris]